MAGGLRTKLSIATTVENSSRILSPLASSTGIDRAVESRLFSTNGEIIAHYVRANVSRVENKYVSSRTFLRPGFPSRHLNYKLPCLKSKLCASNYLPICSSVIAMSKPCTVECIQVTKMPSSYQSQCPTRRWLKHGTDFFERLAIR